MSLKRTPRGEGSIKLTAEMFANTMFNEQIDTPLVPKQFLLSKTFNDLEVLALPLHDPNMQLIGLMRVYSTSRFTEEMQGLYEKTANTIG